MSAAPTSYVNGAAVAGYGAPLTIFGVANVAVPAAPAAGKGYEIFRLEDQPPGAATAIYSGADDAVEATAGVGAGAKITAWLVANNANVAAVGDLNPGDTFVATDGGNGPQATVSTGSYIYGTAAPGSRWVVARCLMRRLALARLLAVLAARRVSSTWPATLTLRSQPLLVLSPLIHWRWPRRHSSRQPTPGSLHWLAARPCWAPTTHQMAVARSQACRMRRRKMVVLGSLLRASCRLALAIRQVTTL